MRTSFLRIRAGTRIRPRISFRDRAPAEISQGVRVKRSQFPSVAPASNSGRSTAASSARCCFTFGNTQ